MGGENHPCKEKYSFHSWSVMLDYLDKTWCQMPRRAAFDSLGLRSTSASHRGGNIAFGNTAHTPGIAHKQSSWERLYRLCTARRKLGTFLQFNKGILGASGRLT